MNFYTTRSLSVSILNHHAQKSLLQDVYKRVFSEVCPLYSYQNQKRHLYCNNNKQEFAGHSKWSNIKHKKMHKDNARAKVFGKLSLEIIQAVKENGSDPSYNTKLDALVIKAKSCNMPKDKIETSIKNALRESSINVVSNTEGKRSNILVQVRGPGKCGLLVDLLTPNPARSKPELKSILKRHGGTYIEDGSVAFMFQHKGVLTVKHLSCDGDNLKELAEEIAIVIGAEDVMINVDEEEENSSLQFICPPLDVINLKKELERNYQHMNILSADCQYLVKTLVCLTDDLITQADKLIDMISDHPDVLQVYDNIMNYPSKTIKLSNEYDDVT